MKGRKPKPSNLKLIQGNPGHRPVNKNEPTPEREIPSPPDFMSKDALIEWGRVTEHLFKLGLLTDIDRATLVGYCESWSQYKEAKEKLQKTGLIIKTTNGNIIQNPLVGIANKSLEMMNKLAAEFGMTPSSRSRINVTAPGGDKKDAWSDFG